MNNILISLIFYLALSVEILFLAWWLSKLQDDVKRLQYWIRQNRRELNRVILLPLPEIEDPWKEKKRKRREDK